MKNIRKLSIVQTMMLSSPSMILSSTSKAGVNNGKQTKFCFSKLSKEIGTTFGKSHSIKDSRPGRIAKIHA